MKKTQWDHAHEKTFPGAKKILLKMKLTLCIILFSFLGAMATDLYSQTTKLSLNLKKTSVKDVLGAIENQSEFYFLYSEKIIDVNRKVNIEVHGSTIEKILDNIFADTNVSYTVKGRQIVLTTPEADLFGKTFVNQQQKSISGKVTDSSGSSLSGVSVVLKGTIRGTITDANGNYSLNDIPENATLQFSFIGMKGQEIVVGTSKTINAILVEEVQNIEEVVAVGYGNQKKVTLTGAVSSVSNNDIIKTKNGNLQNNLTGKIAGLRVMQKSSEPGTFNSLFDIRGLGSPLVVIDGVPRDNIERLDPNDIESVSVLKDASAAIYGVRAANGVVLITTKKGKNGFELNYSGNVGMQVPSNFPKSLNAIDYMTLMNEKSMHNVNGGTLPFTDQDFEPYRNGSNQGTDWNAAVYKNNAPQAQHNLSASFGNDRITSYISIGYTSQEGLFESGDLNYKKYNVRSNISGKITENLTVDLNIDGISDTKNQPYNDTWWVTRFFWQQLPTQPIYANNNPDYLVNPPLFGMNPVAMSDADVCGYKNLNNKWFQSSISLNYKLPFVKGLQVKALLSYDYNTNDNKLYQKEYNLYTYDEVNDKYIAAANQSPSKIRREYYSKASTLSQLSLKYNRKFNDKHNIDVLFLYEQNVMKADNFFAERELSLPIDQLIAGNSANQVGSSSSDNLYKNANIGLIGRVNYSYKDKYLAEFSFRDDGSSKFATDKQWGFFPAVSAGWRISEENFLKSSNTLSFINNLKLRASYGKMGDDNASSYQFVSGYTYPFSGVWVMGPSGSSFDGKFINAVESKGITNPDITWYVAKTFDIGLDVEAWGGLLGLTTDFFNRNRSGLLSTRAQSLPGVVGANLPQENLNSDRTGGVEFEVSHKNTIGDFSYYAKGILTMTRTRYIQRERAESGNSYDNWYNNYNNRYNDIKWGYSNKGQYQSYDEITNSTIYVNRNALPGDYIYVDWNGDGQVDGQDIHPIATSGVAISDPTSGLSSGMPLMNYSLNLGASWKGFDLNLLFQGAAKGRMTMLEQLREPLILGSNALKEFLDRWHPVDPTADPYDPNTKWVSGYYAYTGTVAVLESEFNTQETAYLRLKSVELGYSLPHNLTSKAHIKNARIYANGYNLFTITKLKYSDPEHPSDSYGMMYPLNKIFSIGVDLKF